MVDDQRQTQYFAADPTSVPRPRTVRLELPELAGRTIRLLTDSGVFSADRIDAGTEVLLRSTAAGRPGVAPVPPGVAGDLVDLGAGYGPIAIILALRYPERIVWAVEPNERARSLCTANASAAGVGERVRVVAPGDVPPGLRSAGLWSNPPIRIGKKALHELLTLWLGRITDGGEAWLVVQRHLGADSLAKWLADSGHQVERIASRRGYRVLRVRPPRSVTS